MFQVGGIGPMFGQLRHFCKFVADRIVDPYPTDRYVNETKRLLGVLDQHLSSRRYILGSDYSIADIATFPWVRALTTTYGAGDLLGLEGFKSLLDWRDRCLARPAVRRGFKIPSRS